MEKKEFISDVLLKRIAVDDKVAFRAFYDEVYTMVYRFVCYFMYEKNDCDDVVSEVFLIIWKQRKELMNIKNFKAWLYTVCRNEVYRYIKQKNRLSNVSIDEMAVDLHIDECTAEGILIEEEMLKVYNKAIAELPERCKLIFIMAREEHLKYKDIAVILSISEGTVEQQMNIAIRKITNVVREYFPEFGLTRKK